MPADPRWSPRVDHMMHLSAGQATERRRPVALPMACRALRNRTGPGMPIVRRSNGCRRRTRDGPIVSAHRQELLRPHPTSKHCAAIPTMRARLPASSSGVDRRWLLAQVVEVLSHRAEAFPAREVGSPSKRRQPR